MANKLWHTYPRAQWRGTLPVSEQFGELVLVLDVEGEPLRLRIKPQCARHIAETLAEFLAIHERSSMPPVPEGFSPPNGIAQVSIVLCSDGRFGVRTTIRGRADAIYAFTDERKLMQRILPQVLDEFREVVQSSSVGSTVTE